MKTSDKFMIRFPQDLNNHRRPVRLAHNNTYTPGTLLVLNTSTGFWVPADYATHKRARVVLLETDSVNRKDQSYPETDGTRVKTATALTGLNHEGKLHGDCIDGTIAVNSALIKSPDNAGKFKALSDAALATLVTDDTLTPQDLDALVVGRVIGPVDSEGFWGVSIKI